MRTMVEIPDEQRAELVQLAARRGEKGLSGIIQEALDLYLRDLERRQPMIDEALSVVGSFSEQEGDELVQSIQELREKWR